MTFPYIFIDSDLSFLLVIEQGFVKFKYPSNMILFNEVFFRCRSTIQACQKKRVSLIVLIIMYF